MSSDDTYHVLLRATEHLLPSDGAKELDDAERLDRYQTVMRHEFAGLGFTDAERGLIADVLATVPASMSLILSLDSEIIEAMRTGDGFLPDKWHVHEPTLTTKLRALSAAQKCAIVEAFERGHLSRLRQSDAINQW